MKRLIRLITIALLLAVGVSSSDAITVINSSRRRAATSAPAAPSPIWTETFDDSGKDCGDASHTNCVKVYTSFVGDTTTVNFDAAGLSGTAKGLAMDASAATVSCRSNTDLSLGETWVKFVYKFAALPASSSRTFFQTIDNTGEPCVTLKVNNSGNIIAQHSGGDFVQTVSTVAADGTEYMFWSRYQPDPGGNTGAYYVAFAVNGNPKPSAGNNARADGANGVGAATLAYVNPRCVNDTGVYVSGTIDEVNLYSADPS